MKARVVGIAACLLAGLPLLVAATGVVIRRPVLYFDGDFAVDELALINSGHLHQLVGNYSRFKWSHPGPSWFYALDAVYLPLGEPSWAFIAATLVLNSLFAALIVVTAWRAGGPVLAVVSAALLLIYLGGIGDILFRDPWPPFAVILPMALVLLLTARGAAGSNPALAWVLVVGSYTAQTHIGTAPTIAAALTAGAAVRVVVALSARRDDRSGRPDRGRFDLVLVALGLVVFCLVWIPPLLDELTGRPGNLTLLYDFFTAPHPKHRYLEAFSVFGRFVSVVQLGSLGTLNDQDLAVVSPANIGAAGAFGLVCIGLAAAGTLARDRFAQSLGFILSAAGVAVIISIHQVVGPVYAYLLLWVSVLPLLAALGWSCVAVRVPVLQRLQGPIVERVATAGAAVVLIALSAIRIPTLLALSQPHEATPDTRQAWFIVKSALEARPPQPVLVELNTPDTWILAAGIALQFVKAGYPVHVQPDMLFMFGSHARSTGREDIAVIVVDGGDTASFEAANPDARPLGTTGAHSIFLRPENVVR